MMLQPIQTVEGRGAIAFGHRGIVEDVVDEVLHRSSIGQNGLADVNQFGSAGPDNMDAQERMCVAVKDHF